MLTASPRLLGSLSTTLQMRISTYDKVVAVLIVSALTAGVSFLLAVIVWLFNAMPLVSMPPEGPGVNALVSAVEDSNAAPSVVSSPEAALDDLSVSNEEPCVTALDEAVVVLEAAAAASSLQSPEEEKVERKGLPNEATGKGHGPIGAGLMSGEKSGSVSKSRRWLFEYRNITSIEQYFRWLEFAGIQPGALLKNPDRIVYLSGLNSPKPETREIDRDDAEAEKRFFITWADGSVDFLAADRELFSRAGIDASDATILHFVSPETEQRLEKLESEFFGGTDISKIRRTIFEIQESGGVVDFVVKRQLLR